MLISFLTSEGGKAPNWKAEMKICKETSNVWNPKDFVQASGTEQVHMKI